MAPAADSRAGPGPHAWLAAVALVLLSGYAVRLWQLDTQSLWHDEAWSVFSAYHPLAPLGPRGADPNAPFAFYATLGLWIRLAGDAVWTMRYWSLLIGTLIVAVAALLARRWYGSRAGVLAALLVAFNPILWVFSQEIRAYILMPLLALVMLPLLDALLRPPDDSGRRDAQGTWQAGLALLAIELFALYAHNLSVPLVAWLNVAALLGLAWRKRWRTLALWLAGQAALFMLYLPWLLSQRQTGTLLNTPPALTPTLLWDIWQAYFTGIKAMPGADAALTALIAALGVVALVGIGRALLRFRGQRTWLLVSQALLLPAFELAIVLAAHIDFHPRYFIVGVPATLVLVAAGIGGSKGRLFPIRTLIGNFSAAAVAILAVVLFGQMATVLFSSPVYQHDDFRAIARRYATLGPQDAVLVPYGWEPTLDYYQEKLGIRATFVEAPLHASRQQMLERLRELHAAHRGEQVELLTWYQLPADVRAGFSCLLGAVGEQQDALTVAGLTTTRYRLGQSWTEDWAAPDPSASPPALPYLQRETVTAVGGDWPRVCLASQWQDIPPGQGWRVALRLHNQTVPPGAQIGWEIGAYDAEPLTDAQLPVGVAGGAPGTVFALLALPPLAPPGPYPVTATLYQTGSALPAQPFGTIAVLEVPARPAVAPFYDGRVPQVLLRDGTVVPAVYGPETLVPGGELRVTLEWQVSPHAAAQAATATLLLEGAGWRVAAAAPLFPAGYQGDGRRLVWYDLLIPPEAEGPASLRAAAGDGAPVVLREYQVAVVRRIFSEADTGLGLNVRLEAGSGVEMRAAFPGVGQLVGAVVPEGALSRDEAPVITLLWLAADTRATPPVPYTVFVHLRSADGQILRQSDSAPAQGRRPTTGWLAGEFIMDEHTLSALTPAGESYSGAATLAVGLYNQATGERLALADGRDFVLLPMTLAYGPSTPEDR